MAAAKKYLKVLNNTFRPIKIGKPAGDAMVGLGVVRQGRTSWLEIPSGMASTPIEKHTWDVMLKGNLALQSMVDQGQLTVVADDGPRQTMPTMTRASNLVLPPELDAPVNPNEVADPMKANFTDEPVAPYEMPKI